jgi:RNA polymerase sigma-70 factor (ECF subfamily)
VNRLTATRWTLVGAARDGDAAAIRALCEKYRPAIVGYLERRGLAAEAEDVAQEALLALVSSAIEGARAGAGKFRSLVFAVARNHLLRHLERRAAEKRGHGRTEPLGRAEPSAPAEPDSDFDREWLGSLLRSALARLEAEQPRAFVALRRFLLDGVRQAEIARELGLSVEQVKKLVLRGKRRVAAYLREEVWTYAGGDYEAELAFLSRLLGSAEEKPEAGSSKP